MSDETPDLKTRYFRWEQHQEGGCPVCGAVIQLLTAEQRGGFSGGGLRLGVRHDYWMHRNAGVPHVGWPHAPIEKRESRTKGVA